MCNNSLFSIVLLACLCLGGQTTLQSGEISSRHWYHSTILYGDCAYNEKGYEIWRAVGQVNISFGLEKFTDGQFSLDFEITERTNAKDAALLFGCFSAINAFHTKRSLEDGGAIRFVETQNGKKSIQKVKFQGADIKVLEEKEFPWNYGQRQHLVIEKTATLAIFSLNGQQIAELEVPQKASFALGVKNSRILITACQGQLDSETFAASTPEQMSNLPWRPLDFGMEHFKAAVQSGIRVHMLQIDFNSFWSAANCFDFREVDARLKIFVDRCPDVRIIVRPSMRSSWWGRENMNETQRAITDKGQVLHAPSYNPYSFASDKWQQDFGLALQQLLLHCENSAYRQQIIGYCPMAGDGGEWSYGFRNYLSDYSEPQRLAFVKYAQEKYNNNLFMLRKAWNNDDLVFEDIQIPDYQSRLQGDLGLFLDPAKSQKIIDFNQHLSQTVVKAIRYMGQIVRDHAPGKLSCFYYGYHFMPGTQNGDLINTGHRGLAELLQAPEIDAIASPQMYYNRNSGGAALSQTVAKSVQLNNKLFLNEDDTRTYLTGKFWPNFPPPFERDYDASVSVLLRNAASTLFKSNGRLMWMEMGVNWFNHPGFVALAQKIKKDEDFQLNEKPEVVLIVSDSSYNHMRFSRELSEPLLARSMMHTFTKLGAPIDTILLSDLEKAPDYRLYVFMDCCILNPQQIDIIQAKVGKNQASVLWMYAPGFGDEKTLALVNSEKLTGFKLNLIEEVVSIRVPGRELLTAQLTPMLMYAGLESGLDSLEMTFGKRTRHVPILQKKVMPGSWTSYWCGAPLIPLSGLQQVALEAGVHLFSRNSDQVFYNGRLLVIHAEKAGNRDISLPKISIVYDWMTEEQITLTKTDRLTINMNAGETKAFRILQ
jgi:hypothetical protein